jgi:hypothetical protein
MFQESSHSFNRQLGALLLIASISILGCGLESSVESFESNPTRSKPAPRALEMPAELCGNGLNDPGEECDYNTNVDSSCEAKGFFGGGYIICTEACIIDTFHCKVAEKEAEPEILCGNGKNDPGESCDWSAPPNSDCADMGFDGGGQLHCTNECTVDTSGCKEKPPIDPCGNGINDPGEACDWSAPPKTDCAKEGFTGGGQAGCNMDCTVDTSGCIEAPVDLCGNGVNDQSEPCDWSAEPHMSCEKEGFHLGGQAGCNSDCTVDTSGCIKEPVGPCGNGINDPGEACDWSAPPKTDCAKEGFTGGGQAGCNMDCTVNTSGCIEAPPSPCGNGINDPGEACDWSAAPKFNCADLGFTGGGQAGCNSDCSIDTSGCIKAPYGTCGNGINDPGEACDWSAPPNTDCQAQGFSGGQAGCNSNCTLDTSGCTEKMAPPATCGNGLNDPGEECDYNTNVDSSCEAKGFFGGGYITCTEYCVIDTSHCQVPDPGNLCGNGKNDFGESCDWSAPPKNTCADMGFFGGGQLHCTNNCGVDTSGCIEAPPTQ